MKKSDLVNHPPHYKAANGLEAIDVIEGFGLGFRIGNAVKYLLRAGHKGHQNAEMTERLKAEREDLQKAEWYIRREIAVKNRAIATWEKLERRLGRNNRSTKKRPSSACRKGVRR